ncbi:MAG TPA: hypothetical protein PLH57_03870 [Oligoflexia bacterium]|nr:hypothetical protein [Oligoflexia bacterium]
MIRAQTEPPVRLAPPGKGLPLIERLLAKYILLPKMTRKLDANGAKIFFEKETQKILTLAESVSPEHFQKPILIDRLGGLEDSSRFWSVEMTLEHLVIVANAMDILIRDLLAGRHPSLQVDIAKVKPHGGANDKAAVIATFRTQMMDLINKHPSIVGDSSVMHPHPWFGAIDAHTWMVVRALHQRIHRKQIENIIRGLNLL